eukprot:824077-Rhodomonas_salina.3
MLLLQLRMLLLVAMTAMMMMMVMAIMMMMMTAMMMMMSDDDDDGKDDDDGDGDDDNDDGGDDDTCDEDGAGADVERCSVQAAYRLRCDPQRRLPRPALGPGDTKHGGVPPRHLRVFLRVGAPAATDADGQVAHSLRACAVRGVPQHAGAVRVAGQGGRVGEGGERAQLRTVEVRDVEGEGDTVTVSRLGEIKEVDGEEGRLVGKRGGPS